MVKGGPGSYRLRMNESEIKAEIHTLRDGGLLMQLDGNSDVIYAEEEAAGTRLLIDGRTCLLQNDHDPSKLVAETTCKLLRYLMSDGCHIDADAPYAEVEVMKMCMPLLSPASGVIHFKKFEGQAMQGMKYRIKNVPAHSLHFGSYCNCVFGSDIKNCASEEAYNLFHQTIFGSFLDIPQCNFQGQISKCILMLELEQGNPDKIHVYVQGTILKFTISEFALISGLKYSTIAERVGNVNPRIFNWKVVGIKVKYEKFMAGMFSKFVYTNLRSTHEEVQKLDLPMIDGVELNNNESALSLDTYPDRSGKRHVVDIHTQSDMDHQGFENFSTVPPPEILMKADSEKTPPSVSGKSMPIDQSRTFDSERLDAPTLTPSSSDKSGHQDSSDQKWNELKLFLQSYVDQKFIFLHKVMVKQHEESNNKRNKQHAELMCMLKHIKHINEKDQQDQDMKCLQKEDVPSKEQDDEL
ncbi:hypothetical protein P3S68_004100 [Capsicum galapagoense]